MARSDQILSLPLLVTGPSDVSRLLREVRSLEDYLHQASLRRDGGTINLPRTSRILEELAFANHLDLLQSVDRQLAVDFLNRVKQQAPVVHISFAVDPSSAFMSKITSWLRQNIHPLVLVQIGLQPMIAAGCILRTKNHYYDLSLRRYLDDKRPLLLQKISEMKKS